jgi:hypothetical protein
MLNFVYLRSSRLNFLNFWLDSCIVNKGGKFELELSCCTHLEGFQVVSSYFWAQAVSQVAPAWPVRGTGLTGIVPRCWAILSNGLTGEGEQSDRSELSCCSCSVSCGISHAFDQGELHWFRGSLHVCRGSSMWFFELWIGGLHSLLEHSFVSDVWSRCPYLRGPRLIFLRWPFSLPFFGFRSLVGVSFYSFLFFFFSRVTICVCCQCTHQGGDWGPCVVRWLVDGRFLVWWVIGNVVWTDSWLSIAGAGCGLTGVSAGEEQAWKVVAGEASWCGEDK